jgi:alpha-D-ribose 1-methylphosphonate 5-triphosphate synthase subunit PhnH
MTAASDLAPGFADPVADAQAAFRALLAAFARPGSIHPCPAAPPAPAPLGPAAAALLLTLTDPDTSLAIDPCFASARGWIGFHAGPAPAPMERAAFVLAAALPDLATLAQGSDEAPEEAATVILQIAALGRGARYRLAGPGLKAPAEFAATGLPAGFAARWAANRAGFPRGIDLILCAGGELAALPRSVSVEEL